MGRLDGFSRTLVFGVLAGLGVPTVWLALAPVLGGRLAFGVYTVAAAVAYGVWVARDRRARVTAGLAGGAGGLAVLVLGASTGPLALGAALLVSLVRSGLLFRSRPLRAFAIETALAGGGLALAALLSGPAPGVLGLALGVWGYFLVQSGFFLVAGVRRREPDAEGDDFERARARLDALLEQEPG